MENLTLMATVENGIEVVNIWDYPEADFMSLTNFIDELSSMENGDGISVDAIFTHYFTGKYRRDL